MIRCLVHWVRSPVLSHLEAALGLAEVIPERWVLQARAPPVPVLRPWQPGTPAGFHCVIPSRLVGVVQTSAVDPSSGSSISFLQNFWEMGGHPCSHTCGPQPSTLHGRAATRKFWPLVTLGPPGCLRPLVGLGVGRSVVSAYLSWLPQGLGQHLCPLQSWAQRASLVAQR